MVSVSFPKKEKNNVFFDDLLSRNSHNFPGKKSFSLSFIFPENCFPLSCLVGMSYLAKKIEKFILSNFCGAFYTHF